MKKYKYIIVYIIILIIYIISLTISAYIPNTVIKDNIIKSSKQLLERSEKTCINTFINKTVVLFNFTDALMLNTTYSTYNSEPFKSAMLCRRNYVKNKTANIYQDTNPPGEETVNSASYTADTYQTKELSDTVNEKTTYDCIEYARYWHGYMVILKPLLIMFDYNIIQIISMFLFIILSIIFIYLITKKIGNKEALAFGIAFIFTDLSICSCSLNAIMPFLISIISSIIFIIMDEKIKSYGFAFLLIGSLTSFFDLFTTPVVTLGIPIIIKVLLDAKKNRLTLKNIIKHILLWGIGFGTTMVFKWIITDIFFNRNVVITSIKQFIYRTGNGEKNISYKYIDVFKRNIYFLGHINAIILLILFQIMLTTCFIKKNLNKKKFSLFLILLIPILWFAVFKNHSMIHAFFTYRILILTIICTILIIFDDIKIKNRLI